MKLIFALLAPLALAQSDLRGIYIYTNDVSQITTATASQLTQSFSIPGVDGVAIVVGWNSIEPARSPFTQINSAGGPCQDRLASAVGPVTREQRCASIATCADDFRKSSGVPDTVNSRPGLRPTRRSIRP